MKNLLKKIVEKIKALFDMLTPKYKQSMTIAIAIVDQIYKAIDNPLADVIVLATPTGIDDKIQSWLKAYLPTFLKQFKLFAEVSELTDTKEIILKVSEILQGLNEHDKNGERLKIAVSLAIDLTGDGKLDWSDAVKIIQSLKDKSI